MYISNYRFIINVPQRNPGQRYKQKCKMFYWGIFSIKDTETTGEYK